MTDSWPPTELKPIDAELVPQRILSSGASMPSIGVGTFGSDHAHADTVAKAVASAISLGYRHVDCASVYSNETDIGRVISSAGVGRDDLWISSKVWNDAHDNVAAACERTLRNLQLDHLDNYLIHWPFPNFHPPHCDVDERNPDAVAFSADHYLSTWSQMEALVERGLVRHIGTSNMTIAKLDMVLPHVSIAPSVNQLELHPHFQQPALFEYLVEHDIEPIGFCPIGSPARPARDRTRADTSPTTDPVLVDIASAHGMHPASVCVRWAIDHGHTPIPFSTQARNLHANLAAAVSAPFSPDEMDQLEAIDRDCRLIKGQVFLWKDDQSWTDLWDQDGLIAD